MSEFTITNDETGAVYRFPSEAAYEASLNFYNDNSKEALIAWYIVTDDEGTGAIWADADCTTLAPDWADVICVKHAGGQRIY